MNAEELLEKLLEIGERKDSLEIGTSKTGVIKIYGDFRDEKESADHLDAAMRLRARATGMQEQWDIFLKQREAEK